MRSVHRCDSQPCGQNAVEGGRGSAALDVAQDRRPRLEARPLFDLLLESETDAPEACVAKRVGLTADRLHRALLRQGTLGDDDDREEAPARATARDRLAHLVDVERLLRDQ